MDEQVKLDWKRCVEFHGHCADVTFKYVWQRESNVHGSWQASF